MCTSKRRQNKRKWREGREWRLDGAEQTLIDSVRDIIDIFEIIDFLNLIKYV
jgi:hypothetical protein